MKIFGKNIGQTQIAIDEAMAELGWLDGATAADNAGITEHTISWKAAGRLFRYRHVVLQSIVDTLIAYVEYRFVHVVLQSMWSEG